MSSISDSAALFTTSYDSPLGRLTLASDGSALSGLWFCDQKHFGAGMSLPGERTAQESGNEAQPGAIAAREFCVEADRETAESRLPADQIPVFSDAKRWLDLYFSGKTPDFLPKLRLSDNPFRRRVQEILLTIPYGRTMTYGDIAQILASERGEGRMSAQAVGGAVGRNSIGIIIPCHRVVGANRNLTGYAGGIDKKVFLLELEGISCKEMRWPKER